MNIAPEIKNCDIQINRKKCSVLLLLFVCDLIYFEDEKCFHNWFGKDLIIWSHQCSKAIPIAVETKSGAAKNMNHVGYIGCPYTLQFIYPVHFNLLKREIQSWINWIHFFIISWWLEISFHLFHDTNWIRSHPFHFLIWIQRL